MAMHSNSRTIRGGFALLDTRRSPVSSEMPTVLLAPEIERDESAQVEMFEHGPARAIYSRPLAYTRPSIAEMATIAHQRTLRGRALDAFLNFRWLDAERAKLTAGGRRLLNDESRALEYRERLIVKRFAEATFERSILSTMFFGPCVATPRFFRHASRIAREFIRGEFVLAVVVFAAVFGAALAAWVSR